MARELPQHIKPWYERLDREDRVHQAGQQLRALLRTPEDCDRYLEQTIGIEAGHFLRMSNELRDWAQSIGDEAVLLEIERNTKAGCAAIDSTIAIVKRWKARLEEEGTR